MKVLILSNPTSGNANQALVEQVQEELKAGGAEVELYLTLAANDATAYLENYSGPLDVVAVAGGDGTINEAINGLKNKDSSSFRLALIPTGTTNLLAGDRKSTRLNSSHVRISYAVFSLKDMVTNTIYTISLHDALPISNLGC